MKILHLQCRSCGAPMEVKAKHREVACEFCGATGLVREEKAERRMPGPLDRLDAEWRRERRRFERRNARHEVSYPDSENAAIAAVFAILLFVGGIAMAVDGNPSAAMMSLLAAVALGGLGLHERRRWRTYEDARRRFLRRRREAAASSPEPRPGARRRRKKR